MHIEQLEERRLLSITPQLVSKTVTGDAAGGGFSSYNYPHQLVSADGRYVAFTSSATNLVSGMTVVPGVSNVYRYDRLTGHTDLVSINTAGTGGANANAAQPAMSADGSVIAFTSNASNLHPLDADGFSDIFIHNMVTGATQLVSINQWGTGGGHGSSYSPSISADGNVVAFRSTSNRLHPLDTSTSYDVFARNVSAGTTQLVTINATGTGSGNSDTYDDPIVSADGSVVVFSSNASNLHALDHDTDNDVFARNLITNTTYLVSVNAAGTDSANSSSGDPTLSADGRRVAFSSRASDLDLLDHDAPIFAYHDEVEDVFVRDLTTNVTQLVSVNASGSDSGDGESYTPVISADGNVVAFESFATDLQPTPFDDGGVFARNLETGKTYLVSVGPNGVPGDEGGWDVTLSADGRMVSFASESQNLTALYPGTDQNVYVHNFVTGSTQLVSVNHAGTSGGNSGSTNPVISADGTTIAFSSLASDLAGDDTNAAEDVFAAVVGPPPSTIFTVDTLADESDGDFSAGDFSLREAIERANAHRGADTIQFSRDLFVGGPATIRLTHGDLTITDGIAIDGAGAGYLTIDAAGNDSTPDVNNGDGTRIFTIQHENSDDFNVVIGSLTLTGGDSNGSGGAIFSDGSLQVIGCVIQNNSSFGSGGGICAFSYFDNSQIAIEDCVVSDNSAIATWSEGGGIAIDTEFSKPSVTIKNCRVYNNSVSGSSASNPGGWAWGGGIYVASRGTTLITNNNIYSNTAQGTWAWGGGLYVKSVRYGEGDDARIDIVANSISQNACDAVWSWGGGIGLETTGADVHLVGNAIAQNILEGSTAQGGGLWIETDVQPSSIVLDTNHVTANEAADGGGAFIEFRRNNTSEVLITHTEFDNNVARSAGGGLYINQLFGDATVRVESSTIAENTAVDGGAIFSKCPLEINDSTISGNHAGYRGGGIAGFDRVDLNRSTITGNVARAGGGVYGRSLHASGTILAGNQDLSGAQDWAVVDPYSFGPSPPNPSNVFGLDFDFHFCLVGTNSGVATFLVEAPPHQPDANGNLIGGAVHGAIDPRLASLDDNGGPTRTHELLPNSPAIDHGDPGAVAGVGGVPANDQRGSGFIRVVDGDANSVPRIDMGAVEQGALHLTVTTDQDNINYNDGQLSLREAILATNASPEADTIDFNFGHPGPATISLQQGELLLTGAVTIDGPGGDLLTIDAHQQSRIFNITATAGDYTMRGLSLLNGRTTGDNPQNPTSGVYPWDNNGGALKSMTSGLLTLEDATVENSSTTGTHASGGAIFTAGGLAMTDCQVIGNSTAGEGAEGGGIFTRGGLAMSNSTVADNHTNGSGAYGGGISSAGFSIGTTILDSIIRDNSSLDLAGGISAFSNLELTRSTVSGNHIDATYAKGGGIYAGTATITDSVITNNSAPGIRGYGGGIHIHTSAHITGSTISNNSSGFIGGGIDVRFGDSNAYVLFAKDCVITGNSSAYQGGGIQAIGGVSLDGCVVSNNSVSLAYGGVGGGVRSYDIRVKDSLFEGNSAPGSGAIYCSDFTIINSTFTANRAIGGGGGAIFSDGGGVISNSTISGNSAVNDGGLSVLQEFTLLNCTVTNNAATNVGGGIHASSALTVTSSIVAGNSATHGNPDIRANAAVTVKYSVIGNKLGTTLVESHTADANGNFIGNSAGAGIIDPKIGLLADNGGKSIVNGSKMLTHALLPGSVAIGRGDPNFNPANPDGLPFTDDATPFDGRGGPYARISGGRIDIGAFEVQSPPLLPGDFNLNGEVELGDYLLWRRASGSSVAPYTGADASGNGVVEQEDFDIWRAHFGQTMALSAGATTADDGAETSPTVRAGDDIVIDTHDHITLVAPASSVEQSRLLTSGNETDRGNVSSPSMITHIAMPPIVETHVRVAAINQSEVRRMLWNHPKGPSFEETIDTLLVATLRGPDVRHSSTAMSAENATIQFSRQSSEPDDIVLTAVDDNFFLAACLRNRRIDHRDPAR